MPIRLLPILALLTAASVSNAGVVEFENEQRPDFFAAVGGEENVSTVDFTGFEDFTPITDQWAHLGVHFSGFVVTSGPGFVLFPNDGWGVRGEPDINVTFDEPINWIAADLPGQTEIELYADDQLIYASTPLGLGGPGNFGGLISDQPFDRARFFSPGSHAEFLDDLFFGPPIPTPGALAVLGVAFMSHRRRGRNS